MPLGFGLVVVGTDGQFRYPGDKDKDAFVAKVKEWTTSSDEKLRAEAEAFLETDLWHQLGS